VPFSLSTVNRERQLSRPCGALIAALRLLGIATRFVSGYLHLADDDDRVTGGNTHAWVQVYVPGPGWVDFDPSSGMVGNQAASRSGPPCHWARAGTTRHCPGNRLGGSALGAHQ
jgi:transglutaminase-like putative cysteine protease